MFYSKCRELKGGQIIIEGAGQGRNKSIEFLNIQGLLCLKTFLFPPGIAPNKKVLHNSVEVGAELRLF